MPLKSRQKTGKKAAKSRTPKSDVKSVRDTAVLKREPPAPNTSAFKAPSRAPLQLEKLDVRARKRLVTKLIPNPEPPPEPDVSKTLKALEPPIRRFHGTKLPLHWFPRPLVASPCADKFGYMFPASVRNATKLPFNATIQALLTQLGNLMGDAGRDSNADSVIPAGYT